MSALSARDLGVQRAGRVLLRETSIDVVPGELHVLLGANGAGKSTLLRALAGEWAAQSGSITLDGQALQSVSVTEQARRRAVLPQQDSLAFPFIVEELVSLGCHAAGDRNPARIKAVIAETLEATDMTALARRPYVELSGGERRRAQLARVLAQVWQVPGAILLLDEPVASLDPAHQHALLHLLQGLARQGFAILASLHELNLAAAYAYRVSLLRDGRLIASGEPATVLSDVNLKRTYGDVLDFVAVEHRGRRQWLTAHAAMPKG